MTSERTITLENFGRVTSCSVGRELRLLKTVYRIELNYWTRRMNEPRAIVLALLLCGALCGCAVTQECKVESCADDSQITANIRSMFDQRAEFRPPYFVYVKTVNHVVYLTGQVNTDLVRESAESIVRDAADGTRVVNSIALTYP